MQIRQGVELPDLFEVPDIAPVQVESLQAREAIDDLILDLLEVVVGQVDPQQLVGVPHNVFQNGRQAHNSPELVLLQEQGGGLFLDEILLLLALLLVLLLLLSEATSCALGPRREGDVVLLEDLGDLLGWGRADHSLTDLFVFLVL